jgi:ABC-type amino acid transport substrate-binding protein
VSRPGSRRAALLRLGGLAAAGAWPLHAAAQDPAPSALEKIRARGRLTVAVYKDMPPFSAGDQGIDIALAEALAKAIGVSMSLLPFPADENVNDDLRNMVWRGHYLGFGPADVMLHAPVDRPLMADNPRVEIFAPYYRERVLMARNLEKLPRLDSLSDLGTQRVAVEGLSLAGWLLIGAEGGRYASQLTTKLDNGVIAAQSLQRGEVAAAAGLWSELESVLGKDRRFAIEPLPLPQMKNGWAVGMAVKKEATDLARALQAATNELAASGEMARIFAKANLSWRAA